MDWANLQKEHAGWLLREFPGQPPEVPAAGMVEEAGELLHCLLKMEQARRWGREARHGDLGAALVDAVGDCLLYACSFCNATGWSLAAAMTRAERCVPMRPSLVLASELVSVAASASFSFHTPASLYKYLDILVALCIACDVDFERAVEATWSVVRRRTRARSERPRVVCLCGSTRFKQAFIDANFRETMAGRIVLSVGWFGHADGSIYTPTEAEKAALDELHLRKIDLADEVLVLDCEANVCDACGAVCTLREGHESACCGYGCSVRSYVGESTGREIAYAGSEGKPVRFLSKEGGR